MIAATGRRDKLKKSEMYPIGFKLKPIGDEILKNVKKGSISLAAITLKIKKGNMRIAPIYNSELFLINFFDSIVTSPFC